MTCEKAKCSPSSEFSISGITNLTPQLGLYDLGTSVTYTCPNGISRKASCIYDIATGMAAWGFDGRCSGICARVIFISFKISHWSN